MTTQNRLTRDQVIGKALNLADIPALDAHDRSNGSAIDATAFMIDWLQEIVDWFHAQIPMAGLLTGATITITTTGSVALPSDFLIDLRDGIFLTADPRVRLTRVAGQEYVQRLTLLASTTPTSPPIFYFVLPPNVLFINRNGGTPDKSYAAQFWYYALPAALATGTVPNFPSDLILVEYLKLKAQEWCRSIQPGTAEAYAKTRVADLQKNGLFMEPESDTIPLDPRRFVGAGSATPWGWLGELGSA